VVSLVREKEERIFILMQMNGLRTRVYYLVHCLTFFILYIITSLIFIIAGIIGNLSLFTKTNGLALVILFMTWGIAQVSLAVFISALFQKAKTAYNSTTILVLISVISFSAIQLSSSNDSFSSPESLLWAPFAFYKALSIANRASFIPFAEVRMPF
jgi:hypothetical protein